MEKIDYDARLHEVYAAGRRLAPGASAVWTGSFARHLPDKRPLTWLDLGSGTGRMTPALAEAFGGRAYGVEPSERMRAQAVRHPAVTYTAGAAERIPLPDHSCDAALLFFVWHHVDDRESAVRELRRVVKPGGRLFLPGNFSDRMPDVWWFRVVPEWQRADAAQFPAQEQVIADFTRAGWTLRARDEVTWLRSAGLAEDAAKLELRAVSLFALIGEDAADAGFARIKRTLPTLDDGPQFETTPMLVFEAPDGDERPAVTPAR
jgi:SAM-dependent methyltransferase